MTAKYGYIGYGPDTSPIVVAKQVFSPTGVQTNFTFAAGYQIGYLDVYLNGAKQIEGQDFNATDTSTVSLLSPAQNGDVVELIAYKAYNLAAPSSVGSFTVGGNLTVTGNEVVSTLAATNSVGIGSTFSLFSTPPYQLTVTAPSSIPTPALSYCIADFTNNINGYSQVNIRNSNTNYNSSGDLVITADNGTDTTNFIDLGINNTGFNTSTWTVNGALDGYLYSSNTNFSIGVGLPNRYLSFFTGGTLASNERMRITDSGVGIGTTNLGYTLHVNGTTNLVGNTTLVNGTLVVNNGAAGSITTALTFNPNPGSNASGTGQRIEFRSDVVDAYIEGVRDTSGGPTMSMRLGVYTNEIMRLVGTGLVGIGTTNPTSTLQVAGGDSRFGGVIETVSTATTYMSGTAMVVEMDVKQATTYTYTIPTSANIGIVSFKNMPTNLPGGTTITLLATQNAAGTGNTTSATGIGTNITIVGSTASSAGLSAASAGISTRALVGSGLTMTLSTTGNDRDFISFFITYNGGSNISTSSYQVYATRNGGFR